MIHAWGRTPVLIGCPRALLKTQGGCPFLGLDLPRGTVPSGPQGSPPLLCPPWGPCPQGPHGAGARERPRPERRGSTWVGMRMGRTAEASAQAAPGPSSPATWTQQVHGPGARQARPSPRVLVVRCCFQSRVPQTRPSTAAVHCLTFLEAGRPS